MSRKIKKVRFKKSLKGYNNKYISFKKYNFQINNMNNKSSNKSFKGFKRFIDAIEFFNKISENNKPFSNINISSEEKKEYNSNQINIPYAYIGGSYNNRKKYYGYGGFIIDNQIISMDKDLFIILIKYFQIQRKI